MRRGGDKARALLADKRRTANAHPWKRSTSANRVPPTPPDEVLRQADAKRAGSVRP